MKRFLITYTFSEGSELDWQATIARFIAAIDSNPLLAGKLSYSCMKSTKDASYYHLATVTSEDVVKTLGEQDFFKAYTEETERVGGGNVTVTPLEVIGETKPLS
jgi:hypothetical protein